MLKLSLQSLEVYNESKEVFEEYGGLDVELEHSLFTIDKWESIHKKPFMQCNMDFEFIMSYIECMCMTENVPKTAWLAISQDQIRQVLEYIKDPSTATTIKQIQNSPKRGRNRTITSELVYCWMFALHIPLECQYWHFNKLMTLIQVISIESSPPKKMGKKAAMQQQRELNARRRAQYNTKG